MSSTTRHRVCPQCGAALLDPARFCGQCGATVPAEAPAAAVPPKSEHEEETVARARPALEAFERDLAVATGQPPVSVPTPIASQVPAELAALARGGSPVAKTMIDASPFGASAGVPVPPTPVEPPPTRPGEAFGATIADPGTDERARVLREVLARAEQANAAGAPLGKTMLLGGAPKGEVHDAATRPVFPPLGAPPPAAAPEPAVTATPEMAAHDPRRPEASPLSRSVLAPGSWAPPPPPPAAAPAPAAGAAQTMLGMPAVSLPPAPAPAPAPAQPVALPSAAKTMLGVAIPGIAPTQGAPAPAPAPAARPMPSKQGTLMGVAIPGIAPTGGAAPAPAVPSPAFRSGVPTASGMGAVPGGMATRTSIPPPIVPAPPPLQDEPMPAAPALPPRRGIPAVAVVGIVMALVAVGSVAIFFAMRGGGSLTAQPQLDDAGRESLKLACTTCPDGTTVKLGVATATFAQHAAVLPLPAPLSIGDNALVLAIDRPGSGRDEDVKVHVPVAYRVRADLSTLTSTPPVVTVRVEAVPGSEAHVDGKPLALDASGKGAYALDVSGEVEGPSDDVKTIERRIPFSITPKEGKAESGELLARAAVTPLHVDAPGLVLYTDKPNAPFAGQTKPGATVTVEGAPAPVDAQGRFAVRAEVGAAPERTFRVIATAPPFAPRTARLRVVRAASLEAAAKELEQKSPLTFAAFSRDPSGSTGKDGLVEGEVVRAVVASSHSVLLVEDKKSCAAGASCLVRVLHGEELKVAPGDRVRAFGRVNGAVTAGGQTVPELDASLVLALPKGTAR